MRPIRTTLAALAFIALSPAAHADEVVVFAAASLRNALDVVTTAWTEGTGKTAVVSYAASSALARQIEAGAPADIFVSADLDWMDYLAAAGLIDPASRRSLLGNRLVLVASGGGAASVAIGPGVDLAGALDGGRLAIADPAAVPAGRYAKAALQGLGLWDGVADQLAPTENVRAALALVATGEAPLGIVYATDAVAEPGVTVVGSFPPDSHPPIIYPVARIAASDNPAARDLLGFLVTDAARAAFEAQGFTVLE
jgi:molybdate transport system substrate-binding protein